MTGRDALLTDFQAFFASNPGARMRTQVDKETQRVAMRIGESDEIVVETWLYNLTQEEAPLLVHYGTDKTETWLLVRLDKPENTNEADEAEAPIGKRGDL